MTIKTTASRPPPVTPTLSRLARQHHTQSLNAHISFTERLFPTPSHVTHTSRTELNWREPARSSVIEQWSPVFERDLVTNRLESLSSPPLTSDGHVAVNACALESDHWLSERCHTAHQAQSYSDRKPPGSCPPQEPTQGTSGLAARDQRKWPPLNTRQA